jgi:hypothetical protein
MIILMISWFLFERYIRIDHLFANIPNHILDVRINRMLQKVSPIHQK